jgi:cobalamin biosynthetic protein CobC
MLEHGGRLRQAAVRYDIPLGDWLDLSTGINPNCWPVPEMPADCWLRLPENDDGLEAAAAAYYGNSNLLPVAGSQAAIQLLPHLLPRAVVACISPLYAEHPHAWQRAGHRLRFLQNATLPRALATATPYVLMCNPNNPTAGRHPRDVAVDAAIQLKKRGGWLIVDEAFMDPTPEDSLTALAGTPEAPNLIVLRSIGKFFGLAGARVGFVFAAPDLLAKLAELIGPWSVAGPSRVAARLALSDTAWQANARIEAARPPPPACMPCWHRWRRQQHGLFVTLNAAKPRTARVSRPTRHFDRHFDQQPLLRFGLPANEAEWLRLAAALNDWKAV